MLQRNSFFIDSTSALLAGIAIVAIGVLCGCNRTFDNNTPSPASTKNSTAEEDNDAIAKLLATASYVDDASCIDCHADIAQTYQHVAMSKSFYDFDPNELIESFEDNHFFHAPSDNHYEMNVVDGLFELTRYKLRHDGTKSWVHRQKAQYVIGSGNHVRTYLYRNDIGEMFQLPVVWYSQEKKWALAPGYDLPDHVDFLRPITRHCMFCHNAYPEFEKGTDVYGQPHLFPKKLPQGIGCQRCHGPGSLHVQISSDSPDDTDAQQLKLIRNSIVNSAKLPAARQDDVCNQCHFQPMSQRTSFVRKFGQPDYGFRAGQNLSDYMLFFEPDRDNDKADHFEINHHPYRLHQSQCYIKTDNGIRCTHCHDPHATVAPTDRPTHYRNKCFSCHATKDCQDEKNGHAPDANCVSCHMPTRRTTDVIHVTMTDHKIVRRSSLKNPIAILNEIDVPIEMPIRNYAFDKKTKIKQQELYELLLRVIDTDQSAVNLLEKEIQRSEKSQSTPKLALAENFLRNKKFKAAAALYEEIMDSSEPLLKTNMAIAAIGNKEFDSAITILESAVANSPDNPTAWYNLGVAQSRIDKTAKAIESLNKAVGLRPNYAKAYEKLGNLYAVDGQLEIAIRQFTKAIQIDARNTEAYRKLAIAYRVNSHWENANQTLNDGLKIAANDSGLLKESVMNQLDPQNPETNVDANSKIELAKQLVETTSNAVDSLLLQAASNCKQSPEECFVILKNVLDTNKRKAQAGLILSIAQLEIGSKDAAYENYQKATLAAKQGNPDRLATLIQSIADKAFSNSK